MRLLLRAIAVLGLLIAITMAAIIGATYRDTNRFAYLFTHPDGRRCNIPCFFGVDMSVATFDKVDQILQEHHALKQATRIQDDIHAVRYETFDLNILIYQLENVPDSRPSLLVEFKREKPTISDLMLVAGKPQRVSVQFPTPEEKFAFLLDFANSSESHYMAAADLADHTLFNPYAQVAHLQIFHAPIFEKNWSGFTPGSNYLTDYQKSLLPSLNR